MKPVSWNACLRLVRAGLSALLLVAAPSVGDAKPTFPPARYPHQEPFPPTAPVRRPSVDFAPRQATLPLPTILAEPELVRPPLPRSAAPPRQAPARTPRRAESVTVVSLTRANGSPSNARALTYSLTLSAPVTGLSAANFAFVKDPGDLFLEVTSVTGAGAQYTIEVYVGGRGSGSFRLVLATNTGGTPPIAGLPFAGEPYEIDRFAPAAPRVTTTHNYFNGPVVLQGTAEAGSQISLLVQDVTRATTTTRPDGTWQLPPTAFPDGASTEALYATDSAGNRSPGTTHTFYVDTVAPQATLSSSAGSPTSSNPIPLTVTFSEIVYGFSPADLLVTNGVAGPITAGGGYWYTLSVTPTTSGPVTVRLPAGVVSDWFSNPNTAAVPLLLTYAPTATLLVERTTPTRHAVAAARATDVAVTFTQALSTTAATQQALQVHSTQAGGQKRGTASINGATLTFNPTTDFQPGETVFASVLTSVQGSGGQHLAKGHVFQFTAATAAATASFRGSDVTTGAGATGTATGDVDGDGDLDLLTANTTASTVSVRVNSGDGTFTGTQEVSTDSGPYAVALGDVDGDGDLDVVTANANRRTVSVRFNNGAGSFSGSLNVAVGVSPHAVALGDLDADGDLDLLAANYTDGTENNQRSTVSVRLNNGNGGFSGAQEVSIGTRPVSLALGDVDNDGDLDFVTANSNSNTASVRLNDGTGSFSGSLDVPVGYQPHGVVLADVDQDGDLDLLAAHLMDSGVSVRLNNGTGTFASAQEVAVGNGARTLAVGDLDGDGDLDLLTDNVGAGTVSVRLNNGQGSFDGSLNVPVGTAVSDVRMGDLDGNGTLDFVTANAAAGSASVRLNTAPSAAAPAQQGLAYPARRPQELSLYPNPARSRLQLQLPLDLAAQSVQVRVRNALGQIVLEKTLAPQADTELSLANWPAGVYTVQVRSAHGVLSQRLVVR
ncbi:FG-GAP-like repeat-containing protein [Hymenobacter sp. GOD-10R]|uniref:FG-GAP-like repeat-containing protein n=1 Tax=Hymenobacter sp. GOD-10R TaxID=3093922 RepID=UPI002D7A0F73|nr:FG-GAP-like repeat-containing protein [Hymenobacter sp. GOD-10R]WRQ31730.1 FG-GAP-like repeat-containing protein [Hymenobacter sp. GOD-10R]